MSSIEQRTRALTVVAALLATACGTVAEVDNTVATVTPVRGSTTLGEETAAVIARGSADDTLSTDDDGLARLSMDLGPQLLLDRETSITLVDGGSASLTSGRLYAQVAPGEQLALELPGSASARAENAAFSARVEGDSASIYVIAGELSWRRGEERGIASAGERVTLDEAPSVEAVALWDDWTGGLARPGPDDGAAPEGVGMLEARVPDEVGRARWPLVIRRLDVRVRIEGDMAVTEVDQIFFNPASETVEGLYRIRVPNGGVLQRFAVDRDDRLVDGYVREKAQARRAYQQQVYRGSTEDPALLEWDAPGRYRARIYPIGAGETRRIVTRYVEWLRPPAGGEDRLYRYPMGGAARAPHVQEFALSADVAGAGATRVRAGMGATVEEGAVRIRRSDFRPRSDFWLELVGQESTTQRAWVAPHEPPPRAPEAEAAPNEADERDYFYLPLVLPTSLSSAAMDSIDVVILADVSAGTDRSHLELGRSVVESITAHLDADDRIAILSSDLTIRPVLEGEDALGPASPERVERLLDGLARVPAGGATDLGEALAQSAALLDPARPGIVLYVGDAAPTVGELQARGLLERLARLPDPVRLYGVAVGSDSNLDLLETVTRGGGLAMRVEERAEAARVAMNILSHASRPIAHGVQVQLGDGIDGVFPRRPMDAVLGEVFDVVGRVRDELPSEVTVTGTVDGEPFEQTIALQVTPTTQSTDLRLRWAHERLRQLLLEGAGREAVAELGTRYGLITPFTSYYVPSRRELSQMGASALNWIDRPLLRVGDRRRATESAGGTAAAIFMGPLAIAGCASRGDEATGGEAVEWLEEADDSEAASASATSPAPVGAAAPETVAQPTEIAEEAQQAPMQDRGAAARMMPESEPEPDPAPVLDALRETNRDAWNAPSGGEAMGRDTAMGNDESSAIGALMGDQIGDNFGFGGLGLRGTGTTGTGRGGGGTGEGTIGLGNLGTIGHGGGGGGGNGYGRGSGGFRGRSARTPRIRTGAAEVRGSLSREVIRRVIRRHINEVRFCYEQELNSRPDLEGRVTIRFLISPTGSVQSAAVGNTTLNNPTVETCIAQAVRRWTFPAPDGGGVVAVNYPFVMTSSGNGAAPAAPRAQAARPAPVAVRVVSASSSGHVRRHCSDAANLRLEDRRALWRERLAAQSNASQWLRIRREAIRDCEVQSWRDRRAFLSLMLARAGSIDAMIGLYRLLSDGSSRAFARASILRRVRTPQHLRTVRAAFGLGSEVDWALVEQVLERAPNEAARVRALRRLMMQHPNSFELKLRLLAVLERLDHGPEARRLAASMRHDPLADPGVRTAIGEMYLRMGREDDARRVFSEIVEFAPLDELARRRLGDLYRAHGWFEDAYRQYQTLTEIRPDDPTALLLLAQAAAGTGRVDEALRLEGRLMQTAQPGASQGVARTALLWSSVRFARLKHAARESGDAERLESLERRVRRSGVLREAGAFRATLVWSHPDAQLALWAAHPGLSPTRPADLSPELGLEAFHLEELEGGEYRIEVRQSRDDDDLGEVDAQLVLLWDEGSGEEQIELIDLHFDREHTAHAWTLAGRTLTETTP